MPIRKLTIPKGIEVGLVGSWTLSFNEVINGFILDIDGKELVFYEADRLEALNCCLAFLLWKFGLDLDLDETKNYLNEFLPNLSSYLKEMEIVDEEESEESEESGESESKT